MLSSAVTFLVRPAVQREIPASNPSHRLSLSLAKGLLVTPPSHKEEHRWELICLARYGDTLDKPPVQQSPADAESAWSGVGPPPFVPDPALFGSIIADQWDSMLCGQMT